jgi:hypothetical protein
MSYRQIVLQTNIDWQGTLDKIMKQRKKEMGQYLDGYIRPGVFIRVTRKGLIKIKLEQYNMTLLISPKGMLQVTYKTEYLTGDVLVSPKGGIIIDWTEDSACGRGAIELERLLNDSGVLELLETIDGEKLAVQLKKYIRFYGAWEQDWIAIKKLRSKTFQDAVQAYTNLIKITRLLKRVVYDSQLRERVRSLIDSLRKDKHVDIYDVIDVLLGNYNSLDIEEAMRNLFS